MTPSRTAHPSRLAVRALLSAQADALFQTVLNSVEFGIMVTDLEHITLACKGRFGELWGIDIEAAVSSQPDAVREMARQRIVDFDGWLRNLEEVYAAPDLTQKDALVLRDPHRVLQRSTYPVYDVDGELVGRMWTFQDVTQEHRLQRMRDVIHAASTEYDPDPSFIYRRITERVGAFYGSLSLLSIRDGESLHFRATGGPGSDSLPVMQNAMADSYCQFCLRDSQPLIIQNAREHPQFADLLPSQVGLSRYAGVPIFSPEGEALGTLCIMDGRTTDVLDNEDLRFLQVLAVRIGSELSRERQLSTLRSALRESEQHLIESEKLAITGTLAASVAHDIRNILSTISLQISMGNSEPAVTLEQVKDQLERFDLMAHRLLSYARPQRVLLQPVDLLEVVTRVADLLAVHLRISHIDLVVDIPASLPRVSADPARLDHLFVNLGLNAIQAMRKDGRLTFGAEVDEEGVTIFVADTGPGMTGDQIGGLFQPFRTTRPGGFGLGLFSCRQIARECGGDLQVESEIGKGTRFLIRLRRMDL